MNPLNLKSDLAVMLLWYVLLVASASNVLQWQHHRQVTDTLAAEIARLQKKANVAVSNSQINK